MTPILQVAVFTLPAVVISTAAGALAAWRPPGQRLTSAIQHLAAGIVFAAAALELLPDLLRRLQWREDRMRAALEPSMYATDLALDLAKQGVPFREAYRQAADPARWAQGNPEASLAARVSPGSGAALGLYVLRGRLAALD